jgi:Protein of unknown function (DUF429)
VSFRALATTPLTAGKRTWAGSVERRQLLEGAGIAIPDDIGPAGRRAGVDVLDAAVAAWTPGESPTAAPSAFPTRRSETPTVDTAIWY